MKKNENFCITWEMGIDIITIFVLGNQKKY